MSSDWTKWLLNRHCEFDEDEDVTLGYEVMKYKIEKTKNTKNFWVRKAETVMQGEVARGGLEVVEMRGGAEGQC